MVYNLALLLLGLAATPMTQAPASALQRDRARVAILLSDSDTTVRRWASVNQLDSLLPRYLTKTRFQYIPWRDVTSVMEGDGGPPMEWTLGDLFALGSLFRATFMIELRVTHAPSREEVCARVLRVQERALVDSVCVQRTGSTANAVRQLAPELGRRLNQLILVPAASRPPT